MRYTVESGPWVHAPGLYRSAMRCEKGTWNKEASDVAAKLFMLVILMPDAPGGLLKQIAEGQVEAEVDEEEGTVTFTIDEGEE